MSRGAQTSAGAARERSESAAADGGGAPGLVLSTTSHTVCIEDAFIIDSKAMRIAGMQKAVRTAVRLIQDGINQGGFRHRVAMLTLTYASGDDWEPKHITACINCIREYLRRKGHDLYGVWVAELQRRGAIHYHLLIWLPKGLTLPKPDKRGWWKHGSTRIEWARKPIGYLTGYATKDKNEGKGNFPKGARIHGAQGLTKLQKMERRWWRFPKYIRERFPEWRDDVIRAEGGGFTARATGEWMPGLYVFLGFCNLGPILCKRLTPEWEQFFLGVNSYHRDRRHESPRDLWRLHHLRKWSHEEIYEVFAGAA